ncbi:unnamed protein product [Caretta caretta]
MGFSDEDKTQGFSFPMKNSSQERVMNNCQQFRSLQQLNDSESEPLLALLQEDVETPLCIHATLRIVCVMRKLGDLQTHPATKKSLSSH